MDLTLISKLTNRKEHNLEYPNTGLSIWSCCECQVRKLEPSKNNENEILKNVNNQRLAVGKEYTMQHTTRINSGET